MFPQTECLPACEGVFITHLDEHNTDQQELAFSLSQLVKQYERYSEGFKKNSVEFPDDLKSTNVFSSSLSNGLSFSQTISTKRSSRWSGSTRTLQHSTRSIKTSEQSSRTSSPPLVALSAFSRASPSYPGWRLFTLSSGSLLASFSRREERVKNKNNCI